MSDLDPILLAELRRDEGVVDHAYTDSAGYLTIGVGRLIDPRKGGRITPQEIDLLLANDVARVEAGLDVKLPWWRSLDPVRRRVLVNMAFNLGVAGLLDFKTTLDHAKARRWAAAANAMLASRWARQVGARAQRLAHMMQTGEAP